jgi:hypothetical protein
LIYKDFCLGKSLVVTRFQYNPKIGLIFLAMIIPLSGYY